MVKQSLGSVALVHGIVGLASCLCLIVFYLGADAFGSINDVGNAVLGVLSAVLAWWCQQSGLRVHPVFVGIAILGAAITVVGSVLILSDITGFYLAGLWSATGFGLIGGWVVAVSRVCPPQLRRGGLIAGVVMLLGLINAPGIPMGLDDMSTAPAWTFVGGVSWAGTYLLFPAWSLRLSRVVYGERIPTGTNP